MQSHPATLITLGTALLLAACGADKPPRSEPVGRETTVKTDTLEQRDRRMEIDSAAKRRERQDLTPIAKPQQGVDALKGKFPRPTHEIPGVVDAGAGASQP